MSTTELLQEIRRLSHSDRLLLIEAATALVKEDLSSHEAADERIRAASDSVRDLYEPGGELSEWTALDAEEFCDDTAVHHAPQG